MNNSKITSTTHEVQASQLPKEVFSREYLDAAFDRGANDSIIWAIRQLEMRPTSTASTDFVIELLASANFFLVRTSSNEELEYASRVLRRVLANRKNVRAHGDEL